MCIMRWVFVFRIFFPLPLLVFITKQHSDEEELFRCFKNSLQESFHSFSGI